MKVAVIGKGGSGKTTTAAILARSISRRGHRTLALDCDSNPNLGISLGLGETATEEVVAVREAVDAGERAHAESLDQVLEIFGVDAPDGVRLAVVSAIENPDPGCPCCGISPEQTLGQLSSSDLVVVADFEAGLGTVMRLNGQPVDVVVVVVEPMSKSIEVGRRACELVAESGLGRVVIVANRLRDEDDLQRVRDAFPDVEVVAVPDDPAVVAAERAGEAPLDSSPQAPAVQALVYLAHSLVSDSR